VVLFDVPEQRAVDAKQGSSRPEPSVMVVIAQVLRVWRGAHVATDVIAVHAATLAPVNAKVQLGVRRQTVRAATDLRAT
jgi:hypothetical protein